MLPLFGLQLRKLSHLGTAAPIAGWGLVGLGAFMIATAAFQHARFCRRLEPAQLPRPYWLGFGVWVSVILAGLGAALAGYLLWSIPPGT